MATKPTITWPERVRRRAIQATITWPPVVRRETVRREVVRREVVEREVPAPPVAQPPVAQPVAPQPVTPSAAPSRRAEPKPEGLLPIDWRLPLLELVVSLFRQRWWALGLFTLACLGGLVKLLKAEPFYRASAVAVLLPREKPVLDATINTGALETSDSRASREDSGGLMLPPNPDLYIAMLYSRPVMEVLLEQFEGRLDNVSERDRSDEAVDKVRGLLKISGTEEGMLTVEVTASSPVLAADLANALIAQGEEHSKTIERQLVLQQAGFLDEALKLAAEQSKRAEVEFEVFCAEYRMVDPGLQAGQAMRALTDTRTRLTQTRTELEQRLLSYTDSDPGVQRLRLEVQGLEDRERSLRDRQVIGETGEADYGRLIVEYDRLKQHVRYRRDIQNVLSTQAEIFRIRAEQPAGNIAKLRPAVPVFKPAGPSKKKYLGLAIALGVVLGVGWALVWDQWRLAQRERDVRARLRLLRRELPWPLHRLI